MLNANGSRTETVADFSADGTLLDRTVTTTSADGLSTITQTDSSGSGNFDQAETDVTVLNADGSKSETVSDLSANGSLEDQTVTTTSANGLSITTQTDSTGDGAFDRTRTDVTVLNADGSRTDTVTDFSASGAILDQTVSVSRPNGSSTVTRALDGVIDQAETIAIAPNGSRIDMVSDINADGSLKDQVVTTTSANGLLTSVQRNAAGSGITQTDTTVTILNPDGSRTETVICQNADGSLRYRIVTATSADGLSKTVQWDDTGSGTFNRTETDVNVLNADGGKTETITDLNPDGSIHDQTVTITSADQKTVTVQRTQGGTVSTEQTEVDADGSTVTTIKDLQAGGALKDEVVMTTSANGLVETIQRDPTGSGSFTQTDIDVAVLNADGSRTETVTSMNASWRAGCPEPSPPPAPTGSAPPRSSI